VTFDIHTLLYCAIAIIIGFQSMFFWVFAKIYATREGFLPSDPLSETLAKEITLERGLLGGGILLLLGIALTILAVTIWGNEGFGVTSPSHLMRMVIPATTLISLGFQIIYGASFISLLGIRGKNHQERPDDETAGTARAQEESRLPETAS
jgi:hypothetical protein